MNKVAIVTGATRGIGKAAALSLAREGFDVVVTGRTVKEGEGTATRPFAADPGTVAVPGSLETTVKEVEALGRRALPVVMDVLDRRTIDEVVKQTLATFGRIDLLLNNALYQGPGLMYSFAEFDIEQLEKSVLGNLVNQAYLARLVLPHMIARGGGIYISLSSHAAVMPPPAPPGKGGWGFVYGAPKSGFHRIAEFLHVEHVRDGILAFNVHPGFTVTEATVAMFGANPAKDFNREATLPPVTGDVVAWLATRPEARELAGTMIAAPGFFAERGIVYP
ncbi:MAG: SDR family oxidoreductase [Proteobacteria bacterium]|nr:SDR family oxidoreductase [Pseudomonadota bacterium]HQR03361.1 SDR family oxidoreductase [Rhodocyclaceae bacterium]